MYSLIVFRPFSLQIINCVICKTMQEVLESAEKIDPNVDVEPLFYSDQNVETDSLIFALTKPEYANRFAVPV